jgi:hypothetical protein
MSDNGHNIVLDKDDPVEAVLIPIIETNRRKRADYALDGDIFSNFTGTARFAGFEAPWLSALFNCSQKLERISSLRANGRLNDPRNEAVEDTLLDNAVYAIIALAIYKQIQAESAPQPSPLLKDITKV